MQFVKGTKSTTLKTISSTPTQQGSETCLEAGWRLSKKTRNRAELTPPPPRRIFPDPGETLDASDTALDQDEQRNYEH